MQHYNLKIPTSLAARIVPSPHPEYLHALLLDMNKLYGLLHSDAVGHPKNNSKSQVQYQAEWKIDNIVKELSKKLSNTRDSGQATDDMAAQLATLTSIQEVVAQEYEKLRPMVQNWWNSDRAEKAKREQDPRDLVRIPDELVQESGGLMMRNFWRGELGWQGSKSATLANKGKKHEYIVKVPVNQASTVSKGNPKQKQEWKMFFWDFKQGEWMRAPECAIAKDKKYSQRMMILDAELRRIQAQRDASLRQAGLGFLINLKGNGNIDLTPKERRAKLVPVVEPVEIPSLAPAKVDPVVPAPVSTPYFIIKRKANGEGDDRKKRPPPKKSRFLRTNKLNQARMAQE